MQSVQQACRDRSPLLPRWANRSGGLPSLPDEAASTAKARHARPNATDGTETVTVCVDVDDTVISDSCNLVCNLNVFLTRQA